MVAQDKVRVFLLDDHELVRQGLRTVLEGSGRIEIVGESASAQEAVRRVPALRPDVAILDVRLRDGSGLEVCRAVRSVDPGIRALILTSYDDDEALYTAILAGAAGFVLKDIRRGDVVDAVLRVAEGQSLIDPELTSRVFDLIRNGPRVASELAALTDQEVRLLELIAEGLTNKEISERIFLSEKTVKNYVSTILTKLGVERRTQAAVLAARVLDHPGNKPSQ
jgi:DNA-binding NarL/FixJ family response regulator